MTSSRCNRRTRGCVCWCPTRWPSCPRRWRISSALKEWNVKDGTCRTTMCCCFVRKTTKSLTKPKSWRWWTCWRTSYRTTLHRCRHLDSTVEGWWISELITTRIGNPSMWTKWTPFGCPSLISFNYCQRRIKCISRCRIRISQKPFKW